MAEKSEKRIIFILGGARSGKSTFAQQLAAEISDKVLFVATGEPLDNEMKERIDNHRRQRPENWQTLERPYGLAESLGTIKNRDLVLIDCITLLVSNIMGQAANFQEAEQKVNAEIEKITGLISRGRYHFVIVSNEVGFGIVPDNEMAREYRDLLGRANQMLARSATEVYLLTAGLPLRIK